MQTFLRLCTYVHIKIVGKDAACFVRNWLTQNVVAPYNCSVPYLPEVPGIPKLNACEPVAIAKDYYQAIQLVHSGSIQSQQVSVISDICSFLLLPHGGVRKLILARLMCLILIMRD